MRGKRYSPKSQRVKPHVAGTYHQKIWKDSNSDWGGGTFVAIFDQPSYCLSSLMSAMTRNHKNNYHGSTVKD